MIALSPPARYSVILIDWTFGSAAACEMNASTLVAKLSYGWWTITARWRITSKIGRSVSSAARILPEVTGGHGSSLRSGRSSSSSCHRKLRSSGARWKVTSSIVSSSSRNEQFEHFRADVVRHFEADRLVESPASELHLDSFEEIVGLLLLERQVGVATDPERRPVFDDHAHEEPVELRGDQLLDREVSARTDRNEPWEQLRHLQTGESPVAGLRIRDVDRQREREVRDVRERVTGVDGERGEHGEDPFVEPIVEFDAFVVGDVVPRDDVDPRRARSSGTNRSTNVPSIRSTNSSTLWPISPSVCAGVRPSGESRSMPAMI